MNPVLFFWSFRDDPDDPDAVSEYGSSSDEPEKKATFRGSELWRAPLAFADSGEASEIETKTSNLRNVILFLYHNTAKFA